MARGWESKSIEEQQADLSAKTAQKGKNKQTLTPQQQELQRERDVLNLSRTRVLQQLESATHPLQIQNLEQALAHLNLRLQQLESSSQSAPDRKQV